MPAGLATKTCFVTATTERFVPGTLVTLASFLKHHPAFDGDLVVIHHELPEAQRRHLREACGAVRFEQVSPEMRGRLVALRAARPEFAARLGQFYSLEAFRLRGYRKVLFYDSDVLFRASVDELFAAPEPLLCCGDDVFLRGGRRDAATFAPLPAGQPPGAAGTLDRPFGAGFLLIDEQVIAADCYAALLSLVTPETWRGTATTHADQLVLNRYFAGRQTLVGATYDFVLPFAEAIRTREGVDAGSAKVLHFAGPIKPWLPEAMLRWTRGAPKDKPRNAFRLWYDAYLNSLAAAHVRSAADRLAGNRG